MKRLLPLVLLVCLVLACVGCGSASACRHGWQVVLHAVPQRGIAITPQGMRLATDILSSRIDGIGGGSATVAIRGADEIVISANGVHAPAKLVQVAAAQGQLQFFDFEKDLAPPTVRNGVPTPYPSLYSLLTPHNGTTPAGPPAAYYLFDSARHTVLAGPAATKAELTRGYRSKALSRTTILPVPANREVVSGPLDTAATRPVGRSRDGVYWYLFALPAAIVGHDLRESTVTALAAPANGQPEVSLGFTSHDARAFQAITKAEYERGKLLAGLHGSPGRLNQQYAQHNAVVLDGKLEAVPYIDYTDSVLSLGIAGGSMVISNLGSRQAANNLVRVIQSGSLPYRFEQVSSTPGCAR